MRVGKILIRCDEDILTQGLNTNQMFIIYSSANKRYSLELSANLIMSVVLSS